MSDARIAQLAGRQFNRVSRSQLLTSGLSPIAIKRRVSNGRLVQVEEGVYAFAPVLEHDEWGRWMAATLTAAGTVLSHLSAALAWALLAIPGEFETVTRPGSGGPRRHGDVLVHRSSTLEGEVTILNGIPITSVPRTLLDLTSSVSERALARAVREAVRLEHVTLHDLGDALGRFRGRRGVRRLGDVVSCYSGLPIHRARSGAEVRAMEVIRAAGRPLPRLNVDIAGEEADLSWPAGRLIVEIDGRPFHLDEGADARKEATWRDAGWTVRRIGADDVYERPYRLLDLAPTTERP